MKTDEFQIAKLELCPGDTLVVKFGGHLPRDHVEKLRANVAARIPDGVKILVIDERIDLSVLKAAA